MKVIKNPKTIARSVLLAEAEAIRNAVDLLDDQFDSAVETLLMTTGRLVVTGVGKSALIGQKIVATMNSTGTPALFMHAADAIHGDLGMIQDNDVVLIISKSGNTAEIKVLLPLLKRTNVQLIALVSARDSYLAQHANHVLHAYAEYEADPLNLAPTTSTTVALALGDALAVSLLELRGFTRQDFARYHPGGSLGKRLYLKVADIFPHNQCPQVLPDTTIKDVIFTISANRLGATAVVDEAGLLLGIVTDGDIRRLAYEHDSFWKLCAQDAMTAEPVCVAPDDYAVAALQLMQERDITQLIVAESGHIYGFVHLHDLLKEGLI
ncbi:KpsF/GutQ family sugar-phosphate isomerase [Spirosoma sp. KCTC 42546]|uniref:KpsF/GutQ family sugar-phosphate isomerase n=1 Tax=Spirosoma sp. KCTC 42546 TaxID=2520506 RepID=UPI00115B9074|nr:KpsF/GutQ family sugar-phosphate isomerase [Spirosoma sp. KCTC 42546]QDK82900.1 KpsF/GutQ family sugar-phosphate isomerase [Spirosoma sp. KCTC 42546]